MFVGARESGREEVVRCDEEAVDGSLLMVSGSRGVIPGVWSAVVITGGGGKITA